MASFIYRTVPLTEFGAGKINRLAEICTQLQISKPLLVTDPGVFAAGLFNLELLAGCEYAVYHEVQADPPQDNVIQATEQAIAQHCDGIIGFGGGSSMDVAKLVAALVGSKQSLPQMYGVDQIKGTRLPLIQVPTTAGTGSEATAVAIITTGEASKAGVVSPVLFADACIVDPELTLGLPADVTAATGIDAMVHAIEAFTSIRLKNPMSDQAALTALRLLSANIRTAVTQGDNLQARSDMMLGAMLGGQAFANAPVAAVHALAYPLGSRFHISHGLSNSLVLPHVLRFNAPAAQVWYDQIAEHISGIDSDNDNIGARLADYFSDLAAELGLPTRLRELSINEQDLPNLAEQAMAQQRLLINNPREVGYADALAIYQHAF